MINDSNETKENYLEHEPVLLSQILHFLPNFEANEIDPTYLDLTFGGGGHTTAFMKKFPHLKVYAVDQDEEALKAGKDKLAQLGLNHSITFFHDNFAKVLSHLVENDNKRESIKFDMILADIGVSSHHLDSFKRGFSFREDGPLDMRMDLRNENTAADILNHYKLDRLIQVFTEYGEEPFAQRIAEKIVETRRKNPLQTTKELEAICFYSYPKSLRHQHRHPATRVFQALRIEVNQELAVLQKALELGVQLLKPGGRMGIISFHSLEDRIVKNFFLDCDQTSFKVLTKKPLIASEQEIALNRRARSAKLRIIERKSI